MPHTSRPRPWKSIREVLDPRLDTPYPELIAVAGALAERAAGEERTELLELVERLAFDLRANLMTEKFVEQLIARLVEVSEEDAETATFRIA